MRKDVIQEGGRRLGPYLHQMDVAYGAGCVVARMSMHEDFGFFFRQLFC
jgi:hypothetical protein